MNISSFQEQSYYTWWCLCLIIMIKWMGNIFSDFPSEQQKIVCVFAKKHKNLANKLDKTKQKHSTRFQATVCVAVAPAKEKLNRTGLFTFALCMICYLDKSWNYFMKMIHSKWNCSFILCRLGGMYVKKRSAILSILEWLEFMQLWIPHFQADS